LLFNSSPSASATAGAGVELPEPIDYWTNNLKVGSEYSHKNWGIQVGYRGSYFENNISTLTFDNPFRFNQETTTTPLTGKADLYPDNKAHNIDFAGAFSLGKHVRVIGAISPGWQSQNDQFLPYTSNGATLGCGTTTGACNSTSTLPAQSLDGKRQTLAVNTTLVAKPFKKVELKAVYRQYDFNNNTPIRSFQVVMGDSAAVGAGGEYVPWGFNKKNIELSGGYLIGQKSSFRPISPSRAASTKLRGCAIAAISCCPGTRPTSCRSPRRSAPSRTITTGAAASTAQTRSTSSAASPTSTTHTAC